MRAEDRQTGKDSRLSRLLRRALLVVGGAIAAAVITSAPAWADVVEDGVTVTKTATTTVISSVTDAAKADVLPGRVLDAGRGLVPAPALPISLDTGLALLHEFATDLPLASPADLRQGDVVASAASRLDLDEVHVGSPASSTPVVRFVTEPVPPTAASDVIVSEAASTLPSSNATNGQRNDSSPVVPRRGELNGTCHATRTTEAGQLACRTWTSVVRVMSVRVGKQPGRTPD
ncbi:hypothetical protein [Lentzea flava]|uniref:SAF domain-containing protein n=1 Tax=Lentzea flava TaxID=103732 RepID=A0ABQ2UCB2_9PSEU|nr:hypothetical protein [Lentzea flava]MCP2197601.1 hypothetical protein [Lentzea flava]GGU20806.1 hypothetical protein GCM10010178_11270 [Lentzea flava]